MMPVGEQDGSENILDMVARIPAVANFEPARTAEQDTFLSSKSIKKYLRKYLVQMRGPGWFRASFTEHTLPDGQRAFTASRKCPRCGEIETFIVTISDDGEMQFACPLDEE